ncbi:MAG TPA: phospholipase C, phosphocholine-specific [Arachidicoccus sp.]|nr:phospholipase C, phosphocholine-specific [Arachidicoccus sp.]
MDSRRAFLKKSVLLTGAAGIATAVPASIKKAMAINPEPGSSFEDAEHVVILMQENRSFDHCFGALKGVRGFNDPRAVTLPDKNLVWLQTNEKGETYAPFRFDIKDTKITWMGSVPHNRHSQVDANRQGKHDNWLIAKKSGNKKYGEMPLTLGHYTREDLPFNYAMADAFTVCDQHFCSVMSSTWPNRLYLWSGTIRGAQNGDAKAFIRNDIPYGTAHWKTFPEFLEDENVSWKVYQNDLSAGGGFTGEERGWLSNFGCNPLEFLSQYNVRYSPRYVEGIGRRADLLTRQVADVQAKLDRMSSKDKNYNKLNKELDQKKAVLKDTEDQVKKWTAEHFNGLSKVERALYEKAFTTNKGDKDYHRLDKLVYEAAAEKREVDVPKGDVLYQFRKDVEEGTLPTVSWLVPSKNFSDHPTAPWYGSWLTSEILDILTKNPEVWKKTIFILTYDENDGYFDHVPPFVAPDPKEPLTGKCSGTINTSGVEFVRREQELKEGVDKKGARSGPIGLGFRVPMIIASPWSRGGKVCSEVFDHTSSLQFLEYFLEKKFGKKINDPNISDWRRTVCGDLRSVFTRYEKQVKHNISFLDRDAYIERIYNAKFKQEPNNFKSLSTAEIKKINEDPTSAPWMAKQEPGVRPSTALPYELYAEGALSQDHQTFEIQMKVGTDIFGSESAGSPFTVYIPAQYKTLEAEKYHRSDFEACRNWHYAVSPGDQLTDNWPLKNFKEGGEGYHFRVNGPNGFYREFKGAPKEPALKIHCGYERSRLLKKRPTGNVALQLALPSGASTLKVILTDHLNGHKQLIKTIEGGGQAVVILDLQKTKGWYDFQVEIEAQVTYLRRYSGRVETGKESITDPVMGQII